MASESGGLLDQLNDVFAAADAPMLGEGGRHGGGMGPMGPGLPGTREAVYDEEDGRWTITIDRERGAPDGPYYATFQRVYTVQFLNPDGQPQQWYDTDGTLASTIHFVIVSGSGTHQTPHSEHMLSSLTGDFVGTNTDTDLITVNGTYARAGSGRVFTRGAERTIDYTMDVTLNDVVGPRGVRQNPCEAVSGTIEGTYHADITFTRGNLYEERTIDRDIFIELADCDGRLHVGGDRYEFNLRNGNLGPRASTR